MPEALLRQKNFTTTDLDSHVKLIKRQVDLSLEDGQTRKLAVQLVSGGFDTIRDRKTGDDIPVVKAWGKTFRAPDGPICKSRDAMCEIGKVWDFMVQNARYVYDPTNIDTFTTLKETLLAGGSDCDDDTVAFAALFGSIGFHVIGRVITVKGNPNQWVHIYPLVGLEKDDPKTWIPLDMTVEGATPGWEYGSIAKTRDYLLV